MAHSAKAAAAWSDRAPDPARSNDPALLPDDEIARRCAARFHSAHCEGRDERNALANGPSSLSDAHLDRTVAEIALHGARQRVHGAPEPGGPRALRSLLSGARELNPTLERAASAWRDAIAAAQYVLDEVAITHNVTQTEWEEAAAAVVAVWQQAIAGDHRRRVIRHLNARDTDYAAWRDAYAATQFAPRDQAEIDRLVSLALAAEAASERTANELAELASDPSYSAWAAQRTEAAKRMRAALQSIEDLCRKAQIARDAAGRGARARGELVELVGRASVRKLRTQPLPQT